MITEKVKIYFIIITNIKKMRNIGKYLIGFAHFLAKIMLKVADNVSL